MTRRTLSNPTPFRKREKVKTVRITVASEDLIVDVVGTGEFAVAVRSPYEDITEASEEIEVEHGFIRGAA